MKDIVALEISSCTKVCTIYVPYIPYMYHTIYAMITNLNLHLHRTSITYSLFKTEDRSAHSLVIRG